MLIISVVVFLFSYTAKIITNNNYNNNINRKVLNQMLV